MPTPAGPPHLCADSAAASQASGSGSRPPLAQASTKSGSLGLLAHGQDGLDRPHLVVGRLAGHHRRLRRDLVGEHAPEAVHGDREGGACPPGGVQHRRVLDGRVRDRQSVAQAPCREPQQPQVHRVGAARREGHLVRTDSEGLGRRLAGVVEQQPRLATGTMQPARVGVPPVERSEENLAGGRVQRRGGGAVEVGRPGHVGNLCHHLCCCDPLGRHSTLPRTARPDGDSLCGVEKDRERGSSVGLQVPKHSGVPRRILRVALLGVTMLVLAGCSEADTHQIRNLAMPDRATAQGPYTYELWKWAWVAAMVTGVIVWGLIFYVVARFRRRSDDEVPVQTRYNLPLEVFYTVAPVLMCVVFFFHTVRVQDELTNIEPDPDVTVEVMGQQWTWTFNHGVGEQNADGRPGRGRLRLRRVRLRLR